MCDARGTQPGAGPERGEPSVIDATMTGGEPPKTKSEPVLYSFASADQLSSALADFVIKVRGAAARAGGV